MARYFRKKPVVITAIQFNSLADIEGIAGIEAIRDMPASEWVDAALVTTIHGQPTLVQLGDWIIPEPAPERFYPCKPDIFAATYEEVDGQDTSEVLA